MAQQNFSPWQKTAWIVGFIVASTSVGLVPKLTDIQTVQSAQAEHLVLDKKIEQVHKECQRQHKEVVDLLKKILEKL